MAADLAGLEKSFNWEVRVLYLVPIGLVLAIISIDAAIIFMGVAMLGILVTDSLFTVIVMTAFLRPILLTLRSSSQRAGRQSEAFKLIARTKWTSLAGVSLAVTSSTMLYINLILFVVLPDTFFTGNQWLNPLSTMSNIDSILNDTGMLLISGLLTSASFLNARHGIYRVGPASSQGRTTGAVALARSQLEAITSTLNITDEFLPPQQQPPGIDLKRIATALQEDMFQKTSRGASNPGRVLNDAVADVVDKEYGPISHLFFDRCVEEAGDMVTELREKYHGIRRGHLSIYKDVLVQIRQEPQFVELQRRSEKLVEDCVALDRPRLQSSSTLSGLYRTGENVSKRYDAMMTQVGRKTGATFHKASLKGLLRVCEKLTLTPSPNTWKPERVCDICRGSIECKDFVTMTTVLRLLCDLDSELFVTGQAGGILEKICITRTKDRFGHPTSGGWADIMVNFYFEDDGDRHICEVQLVHSQLYTVRKNMGAHQTYSMFRAALEIMEMLGEDPEEDVDARDLEVLSSLEWVGPVGTSSRRRSLVGDSWKLTAQTLEAKNKALEAKSEALETKSEALEAKIASLEDSQNSLQAQVLKLESLVTGLE